jgi:hypothetical protein
MAIELLIKITGDNIDEMLDHLTGIELKTSNDQLIQWCEEQREHLASVARDSEKLSKVPHGTKRRVLRDSGHAQASNENNGEN